MTTRIDPSYSRYKLKIVQQPSTGSAFNENLLSRLALAPPLIVQLELLDAQDKPLDA